VNQFRFPRRFLCCVAACDRLLRRFSLCAGDEAGNVYIKLASCHLKVWNRRRNTQGLRIGSQIGS
jgi:hypothetical protein